MPAARTFGFIVVLSAAMAAIIVYGSSFIRWLCGAYMRWRMRQVDRWHESMEKDYDKRR